MAIRRVTVAVTGAAGGAGVATANASTPAPINGRICAIYLEYLDSPPAGTTDVSIVEKLNSPAVTVLTVSNAASGGWFYPDVATVASGTSPIYVSDYLKVTISQADDGDGVNATIVWDDLQ